MKHTKIHAGTQKKFHKEFRTGNHNIYIKDL